MYKDMKAGIVINFLYIYVSKEKAASASFHPTYAPGDPAIFYGLYEICNHIRTYISMFM